MAATNRIKVHGIGGDINTPFTLQTPVASFQAFPAGTFRYCVLASTGEWQIGTGIVSGTSLTRGEIEENYLGTLNQIDFTGLVLQIAQVISEADWKSLSTSVATNANNILINTANIAGKVEDKGPYITQHYDYNDQVSVEGYLMRCIDPNGTDDYPVAKVFGNAFYLHTRMADINDNPLPAPILSDSNGGSHIIRTGQYYKFPFHIKVLGIRINVPDVSHGTTHKLVVIADPRGQFPVSSTLNLVNVRSNEWNDVLDVNVNMDAGTEYLVYLEVYANPVGTTDTTKWTYLAPGGALPNAGEIAVSLTGDVMRVSVTDADGIDHTANLVSISLDNEVKITQDNDPSKWSLYTLTGQGTLLGTAPNEYYEFPASNITQGAAIDSSTAVTVNKTEYTADNNTRYFEDVDYLLQTDLVEDVKGYFKSGSDAVIENNSIYGVDLKLQYYTSSDAWQIRASGADSAVTASGTRKIKIDDLGSFGSGTVIPDLDKESNIFRVTLEAAGVTIGVPIIGELIAGEGIEGAIHIVGGEAFAPLWASEWDFGTAGEPTIVGDIMIGYSRFSGDTKTKAWYQEGFTPNA